MKFEDQYKLRPQLRNIKTQDYSQVFVDLEKIKESDKERSGFYYWSYLKDLEEDIYFRVCLSRRLNKKNDIGVFRPILQLLILQDGLPRRLVFSDGVEKNTLGGTKIDERFPEIADDLKKIVGQNYWQAAKKGYGYKVDIFTMKQ